MEEVRATALAYFKNLSPDQKQKAYQIFREMDSDLDGISLQQYQQKFGSSPRMKKCFAEVDENGDGKLDFNEFITIFYLHMGGRMEVWCHGYVSGCFLAPCLKGTYFVCVDCFNGPKKRGFYLCISCYRDGKYYHKHTNFVDNCMLLQDKITPYGPDDQGNAVVQHQPATQSYQQHPTNYQMQGAKVVANPSLSQFSNILSIGASVATLLSSNSECSIM